MLAKILQKNCDFILLGLLAALAVVAFDIWSLRTDSMVAYNDAASHLAISRRVIDNVTPGFGQLGSSWLPALHLLMLPFIWNDYLWQSGLAGAMVSNIAFVGSVLYGYQLLRFFLSDRRLSFVTTVVLFANPNLLYLSTTAMNEALFVFSALASTVHLLLWAREPQRAYHLIWAGAFSFLTAFNRYEGWFFVIGQAGVLLIAAWRLRGRKWALGTSLLFAHLAFAAPALWLGWNWLIFGDPLFFLHNDYTSAGSQESLALAGLLPTQDSPRIAAEYFWRAMVHILGFLPSLIAVLTFGVSVVALPILLTRPRKKHEKASVLLLASGLTIPGLFLIYTLVQGVTALHVPDVPPYDEYNVRYALFVFPALVSFVAVFMRASKRVARPVSWGVVALLIYGVIPVWQLPWIGLVEARDNQASNGHYSNAITFLREQLDQDGVFLTSAGATERSTALVSDTKILISTGTRAGNPLIHHLGLPMRSFIHEGAIPIWEQALTNPANHAAWIVMSNAGKTEHSRDKVAQQLLHNPEWLALYDLVYKDGPLEIYHLRARAK